MNALDWALRRLNALVGARAVRKDDSVRAAHVGGGNSKRLAQIRSQALAVEKELNL